MTLIEFMRARLDEIEAVANAAIDDFLRGLAPKHRESSEHAELAKQWESSPYALVGKKAVTVDLGQRYGKVVVLGPKNPGIPDHIALHDPAYVLADVAAKRAIVDAYESVLDEDSKAWNHHADKSSNRIPVDAPPPDRTTDPRTKRGLLLAVLHLAAPHADHPGFRKDWTQ